MKKIISLLIALIASCTMLSSLAFMNAKDDLVTIIAAQEAIPPTKAKQNNQTQKKKLPQSNSNLQTKTPQQMVDLYASLRDEAGVLQPNEKQELLTLLKSVEEKHKIRCAVVFVNSTDGKTPRSFANHLVNNYYTDGENGNTALIIDVRARKYHFSTDSKMRKIIIDGDDHGVGYVKNEIVPPLKKDKWAEAGKAFASSVDMFYTRFEQDGEPYDPANDFSFLAAAIAAVLAGITAWGVRYSLVASMSNVSPQDTAREYLDQNSVDITSRQDVFLYTTRTVTTRSKSSRGGGGGGGGSNGGGGGSF